MLLIDRRLIRHFDWGLFLSAIFIPCLGMIVLYSAGYDPESPSPLFPWLSNIIPSPALIKQALFLLMGLGAIVVALSIPPQWLHRIAYVAYALCFLLLVAVLLVGYVSKGSRRWLALGGFNLQPAEIMKLSLILALARYLAKNPPRERGYGFLQLVVPGLMILLPMGLVMKQPDLGTALTIGGVGGAMVLFMGIERRCLLSLVLVVAVSVYPVWHTMHDYQQKRILTLINPDADPRGSGYHIIQSIIAVGSGLFLGKGFLRGTQTQLEFLPEHSTDFIFSVLAEEWGFLGCAVVMVAYFFFLYRMLRVVSRSRDLFAALVAFGVAALIFIHALVNIGMVIGVLPVVGIPLIMFSYGGSSLISTLFSVGIVLGISMRRLFFVTKS